MSKQAPDPTPLQDSNSFECIATDAKNQIAALETCVQKMKSCVQDQLDECKNTLCVRQHGKDKKALSDVKARLQDEIKSRQKIEKENATLKKDIENLKKKLVESDTKNKKISGLLKRLKSKTETSTSVLINALRQRVSDIDKTALLVQKLNSINEPQKEQAKSSTRKRKTRSQAKNSRNKRKNVINSSDYDESEIEEEFEEYYEEDIEDDENDDDDESRSIGYKSDSTRIDDVPDNFQSDNFILRKSDVQWDRDRVITKLDELTLMKIDGKALLLKYVPIECDGRVLHKRTCIYTGWDVEKRNEYYSITEIVDQNPPKNIKEHCVALNLDDLIIIKNKSD